MATQDFSKLTTCFYVVEDGPGDRERFAFQGVERHRRIGSTMPSRTLWKRIKL